MNSHEKASLDAWIQREPDEVELWCEICECDASECKEPTMHDEVDWVTYQKRDEWDAADALYEQGIDSDE